MLVQMRGRSILGNRIRKKLISGEERKMERYRKMAMPRMGGGNIPMGAAGSGDEDDEDDEGAAKPTPPAKGKRK
jgi:hypothetical protein